jgi:hypothetical protein
MLDKVAGNHRGTVMRRADEDDAIDFRPESNAMTHQRAAHRKSSHAVRDDGDRRPAPLEFGLNQLTETVSARQQRFSPVVRQGPVIEVALPGECREKRRVGVVPGRSPPRSAARPLSAEIPNKAMRTQPKMEWPRRSARLSKVSTILSENSGEPQNPYPISYDRRPCGNWQYRVAQVRGVSLAWASVCSFTRIGPDHQPNVPSGCSEWGWVRHTFKGETATY